MFKAIFGILGLLIALAIVGQLAKSQLAALGQIGGSRTTPPSSQAGGNATTRAVGGAALQSLPGANAAGPLDAQAQIKGIQNEMRNRTTDALQQSAERSAKEQP